MTWLAEGIVTKVCERGVVDYVHGTAVCARLELPARAAGSHEPRDVIFPAARRQPPRASCRHLSSHTSIRPDNAIRIDTFASGPVDVRLPRAASKEPQNSSVYSLCMYIELYLGFHWCRTLRMYASTRNDMDNTPQLEHPCMYMTTLDPTKPLQRRAAPTPL